jgi:hypothetical protein
MLLAAEELGTGRCVVNSDYSAQRLRPVRVDLIDATRACRPVDHEPRILQHLEVLRDGGPTDRQLPGARRDDAPPRLRGRPDASASRRRIRVFGALTEPARAALADRGPHPDGDREGPGAGAPLGSRRCSRSPRSARSRSSLLPQSSRIVRSSRRSRSGSARKSSSTILPFRTVTAPIENGCP